MNAKRARIEADRRRRDIATIHIAAKQLGMDATDKNPDSEYRSMLWSVAQVRSTSDADFTGLQRILAHLRARGFNPRHKARPRVTPSREAQLSKIEAILTEAGRPWAYITEGRNGRMSMVRRVCGVEKLEWADAEQLGKLIAALAIDQARRIDAERVR